MRLFFLAIFVAVFSAGCAQLLLEEDWEKAGYTSDEYALIEAWKALEISPKRAKVWEKAGFYPTYKESGKTYAPKKMTSAGKVFGFALADWDNSEITPKELAIAIESAPPQNRRHSVTPSKLAALKTLKIAPAEWKYLLDSRAIYEQNYDLSEIYELLKAGIKPQEIDKFRTARREEKRHGFTAKEALSFVQSGVKTAEGAIEAENGGRALNDRFADKTEKARAEEDWTYCAKRGLSQKEIEAWAAAGAKCNRSSPWEFIFAKMRPNQAEEWTKFRFDGKAANAFSRNGFSPSEAATWRDKFGGEITEIATWRRNGFDPASAREWRQMTSDPAFAKGYQAQGLPRDFVTRLLMDNRVTPVAAAEARRKITTQCGALNSDRAFYTREKSAAAVPDPQEAIGKCYILDAFSRQRGIGGGLSLYRIADSRRSADVDGYVAIKGFESDPPIIFNRNVVVKAYDTIFVNPIGMVATTNIVWAK
ncbi:MAG: hypothetical protein LBU73_00150 [Helicobacteraceae bacterium]|jgi:hypothetical protein|nr:hypothetical protein [Helicobacteraceae bacterium]